jgi:hypothetical protein
LEYVELVTRHFFVDSIAGVIESVIAGMEDVFPSEALKCFRGEELQVGWSLASRHTA